MRIALAAVTATLMLLAAAGPAAAVTRCWSATAPASGGEWNTPDNWRDGVVPGDADTAVFNVAGAGCGEASSVVLAGVDAEVALIQQATTTIIVDGASLTLNGTANAAQILGSVDVKNGGSLTIAAGAEVYAGGTVKLGNPGTGTLTVDGLLRSFTGTLSITDEPSGGGLVTISSPGSLVYDPFNTGVIRARLENDGTVALTQAGGSSPSQLFAYPSAGSPSSNGTFTVSALSTLALRPTRDSTMTVAGSITGAGRLEINESNGPGGTGTVSIPNDDALSIGRLTIGAPSALSLGGSGTAAELLMSEGGGRHGAGTLTAGTASLDGSQLSGGVTKVSGAATIDGGTSAATIRGGGKLRTEGASAWSGGAVLLGAFSEGGTWENAGTLTIDNSAAGPGDPPLQLVAGSATGVLRNLAGATVQRGAPAGTMFGTGRIENAGTINVTAGTMGSPAAVDAGQLVQSGGLTTVSQGAAISMDVTLNGGTLRGSGTVQAALQLRRNRRAGRVARHADGHQRLHTGTGRHASRGDRRHRLRGLRPARGRRAGDDRRHARDHHRPRLHAAARQHLQVRRVRIAGRLLPVADRSAGRWIGLPGQPPGRWRAALFRGLSRLNAFALADRGDLGCRHWHRDQRHRRSRVPAHLHAELSRRQRRDADPDTSGRIDVHRLGR